MLLIMWAALATPMVAYPGDQAMPLRRIGPHAIDDGLRLAGRGWSKA
jgi:hypothetical protein